MQSSETLVNIHKSARSYNPKEKTSIDMLTAAKPKNFKFKKSALKFSFPSSRTGFMYVQFYV